MSRRRKPSQPLADWRSITDDREKYQAYLCSREWADKREAVRHRAGDKCELCGVLPMSACHHLTYARKYNENLDDLQAICQPCHDFTHGKSKFDPSCWYWILRWLIGGRDTRPPMPIELACGLIDESDLSRDLEESVRGVKMLKAAGFEHAAIALEKTLPFRLCNSELPYSPTDIMECYKITGRIAEEPRSWFASIDDGND